MKTLFASALLTVVALPVFAANQPAPSTDTTKTATTTTKSHKHAKKTVAKPTAAPAATPSK